MDNEDNKSMNICRICLQSNEAKYISVFDEYKSGFVFQHINSLTQVLISRGDGYPDKICPTCLLDLETSINFKARCESSDEILHNLKRSNPNVSVSIIHNYTDAVIKKEEPEEIEMAIEYLEENELFTDMIQTNLLHLPKVEVEISEPITHKGSIQCNDCGEFFKSKCKLRVHWKKIHLPKSYVCPTCRRLFKTVKAYNKHMKSLQGPCSEIANGIEVRIEGEGKSRTFFCTNCDYKCNRMLSIKMHLVKHSGQRLYQCDQCNLCYTQGSSLQAHKESAHFVPKYRTECHICGKTYKGSRRLYRHIKTHMEEKYQCDICKKFMKGKKSLQTHLLRHSGFKGYTCECCAASFYTLAELCNHKRKHNTNINKQFKCDLCEYKSRTKYSLKRHVKYHISGEKPYCCKECGQFFTTKEKLTNHERVHYENKKYSCPLCPKMFFCRRSVSKHVILKHNSKMLQNRGIQMLSVKQETPAISE